MAVIMKYFMEQVISKDYSPGPDIRQVISKDYSPGPELCHTISKVGGNAMVRPPKPNFRTISAAMFRMSNL